jgi:hypothetical protein
MAQTIRQIFLKLFVWILHLTSRESVSGWKQSKRQNTLRGR